MFISEDSLPFSSLSFIDEDRELPVKVRSKEDPGLSVSLNNSNDSFVNNSEGRLLSLMVIKCLYYFLLL